MKPLLFILTAVISYLIAGVNSSIILSKMIFKKDIRTCGSGNPGFTNFKRNFGNKLAMLVLFLDLFKAMIPVALSAFFFRECSLSWQLGAAYSGLFCMIGNCFPVWYNFKGGKGFLIYMGIMLLVDWKAWLVAVAVLGILLFSTKYMSLSTMSAACSAVIVLLFTQANIYTICICAALVLLIIIRHKANIVRLLKGTESKFYFKKKS